MTIVVTDHAVERYLQRVRGVLDARPEIAGRVRRAWEAGSVEEGERGAVHVRDVEVADLVFVCIHDVPRGELVVLTVWEEGEDAAVPRRFTDALQWPPANFGWVGRRGSRPRRRSLAPFPDICPVKAPCALAAQRSGAPLRSRT